MPNHDYTCEACGKTITVSFPIERGPEPVLDIECCQWIWGRTSDRLMPAKSRYYKIMSTPNIGRGESGGTPAR